MNETRVKKRRLLVTSDMHLGRDCKEITGFKRTRPDPAQPLPREQRGRSSAPPRSQSDKADAEKRESAGFGDCDCGCKSATDALVERYGPYLPIAVNLHVHKAKSAQDGSGDCCSKAGRGWKPPQIKQRKYRAAGIQRSAKICDEAIRGSKGRQDVRTIIREGHKVVDIERNAGLEIL